MEHQICRFDTLVRGRQLSTQLSIFEASLAELFRFCCCQLDKLKQSRKIVSFSMLSSVKKEDVSQTCFVFDAVASSSKIDEVSHKCCVFDVAKFNN